MAAFLVGQEVFIVENAIRVSKVKIVKISGALCTVKFVDTGAATRVSVTRLYPTEKAAYAHTKKPKFDWFMH